ncbi:MAG: ferritin family protein [Euryarchaeota archaeon]|nr:ferritin family protein [Euryarchaeota archaeon]
MAGKKVMEALRAGLELEREGIEFYSGAAKGLEDERGRATLGFLAKEEERHLRFIEGLVEALGAGQMLPKGPRRLKKPKIFPREIKGGVGRKDRAVLEEARGVELRSIEFYERCLAKVEGPERSAIEALIEAEKGHLEWVEFMRDCVAVHGYWCDMGEYFSLDG